MAVQGEKSAAAGAGKPSLKVLLCSPRGFCAGVDRAIDRSSRRSRSTGRRSMSGTRSSTTAMWSKACAPRARFSSRNWPKYRKAPRRRSSSPPMACRSRCRTRRAGRNLFALDATCPLVTKVHREAEIHHRRGREIVLIGHAGHPEVIGTMGQLPAGRRHAWSRPWTTPTASRRAMPDQLAYVTQTTLSVDDTAAIVERLKQRFPAIVGAAQGRHLLRDDQPAGSGEARRADRRCA